MLVCGSTLKGQGQRIFVMEAFLPLGVMLEVVEWSKVTMIYSLPSMYGKVTSDIGDHTWMSLL